MLKLVISVLTLMTFGSSLAEADESLWNAGAAKAVITPQQSLWMAGYGGRTQPANGKRTELWAKALVLEDSKGHRGLVLTLDLVGIDRTLSQAICETIEEQHGLSREQIVICCSHTHTGPVVGRNLAPLHYMGLEQEQQKAVDEWVASFHKTVLSVVTDAIDRMSPSRLSWGSGSASFAVNRRENVPESTVPQARTSGTLRGPFDHDVPVLAVRDTDTKLTAVLFGYACHATVLSDYQWSGDYPGFAQQELEASHPDCVALFFAGCGADQNPLPRRTATLARHYGRRLATAVDAVLLTTQMTSVTADLTTHYSEQDLPLGDLPSRQQIERNAESSNRFEAARARLLLEQLDAGQSLQSTYPYPISAWKLGEEIQFVALGGEVVVDYALRLKTELSGTKTWVAGYANDVMAYIPSRRVLAEGGYEGGGAMVYYGLPAPWAPEIENQIVNEVTRSLGYVGSSLP
ncbi:neutral/alkaline non-lysosomal ceramidase N-terminal domain-containing protein [Roseimaritima ulvae]|uniref:Neutral ceramidase n=1 Tax=Roseimaritima ulvae TaxID=980254 RepID=A0A5B9QS50_9BACT|nr:neutral/alkaline non-lysosomal ceramidase N-terminal domain-containing protein [Roseimaritima ulvae]QEG39856.1 Neutral ceramidase precursor [Roseimaritima ulvae]